MLDTPCSLVTKQKTCIKIIVTPFSVGIIVEDCPRFDKETKKQNKNRSKIHNQTLIEILSLSHDVTIRSV